MSISLQMKLSKTINLQSNICIAIICKCNYYSIVTEIRWFGIAYIYELAVMPNQQYVYFGVGWTLDISGWIHTIIQNMNNGNKSVMEELKEICNKIVGRWNSVDETQILIFSFTDRLLKQADLTVINKNKNPIQTFYTIGTLPQIEPTINTVFYFDIGYNSQNKYVITSLTKERMDVSIYNYYDPTETKFHYVRKVDEGFADEILRGIKLA